AWSQFPSWSVRRTPGEEPLFRGASDSDEGVPDRTCTCLRLSLDASATGPWTAIPSTAARSRCVHHCRKGKLFQVSRGPPIRDRSSVLGSVAGGPCLAIRVPPPKSVVLRPDRATYRQGSTSAFDEDLTPSAGSETLLQSCNTLWRCD